MYRYRYVWMPNELSHWSTWEKTSGRFSVNMRVIMNTDFCCCGETRVCQYTRRSNAVDTPGTRGNECSIRPGRESSEGESNKNRSVINWKGCSWTQSGSLSDCVAMPCACLSLYATCIRVFECTGRDIFGLWYTDSHRQMYYMHLPSLQSV